MAVAGGLRGALRESRRRLVARRRRQALAWGLLVLVLLSGAAAVVQSLVAAPAATEVPRSVDAADTDGDGLADVVENTLGSDPLDRTPRTRLPEAWIQRFGLSLSDPDLANRTAPYPRAPQSPPAYGAQGLPPEYRMTYLEVYAYGRPATWDEGRDGPHDSGLDPTAFDVNGSGVPYSWLIHFGLDPFDVAALDQPDPTRNVTWTPREAYQRGLHPRSPDGDADGLLDVEEESLGTSPRKFSTAGTGIADGWLKAHGFSLTDPTPAYQDPDRDGLTNLQEFQASLRLVGQAALRGGGLDPHKQSTVDGPIPDGWLARYNLSALDPDIAVKVTQEEVIVEGNVSSRRHLTVLDEYRVARPPLWNESRNGPWMGGSDPTKDDTDGDGLTDLQELVGWDIRKPTGVKRVVSDPTRADTDSDGLTDRQEREGRVGDLTFRSTDPGAPDSDFDGLLDGEELGIVPWRGITLPALDPNADDTDNDGLRDGDEAAYWKGRHDAYVLDGRGYEWGPESRPPPETVLARQGISPAAALAALLPGGDIDGDGLVNILDADSENDGLLDGWEVVPTLYQGTPLAAERARPATDPANPDTDLDGLPDRWELENGLYDDAIGGWNLDPSLWSSFRDDVGDAARDLDDDGTTWYTFHDGQATANVYRATNKVEFEARSHPNKRDTAGDGIPDGWKIFWGTVYPFLAPEELGQVYPGAPADLQIPFDRPLPRVGVQAGENPVIATYVLKRLLPVDGTLVRESSCAPGGLFELSAPQGGGKLCLVVQEIAYDYKAASENLTNPYLSDTDGDGVDDVWEATWHRLGSGRDRVSPLAVDHRSDHDKDGLDAEGESRAGSSPYLKDSDRGGASDDLEWRLHLDPLDPTDDIKAQDTSLDTDRDGVPDTTEVTGAIDATGVTRPTDPRHPDTDRDGLLDGRSLSEVLGRLLRAGNAEDEALLDAYALLGLLVREYPDGTLDIPGERDTRTDPTRFSTAGDGVPDGYAVRYVTVKEDVPTGLFPAYSYGRPAWWNETMHGIWLGGYEPGTTPTRDHDQDGLDDLNGEDPYPVVNALNFLPFGHPLEVGLTPEERFVRAQGYVVGRAPEDKERLPRFETVLTLDALPGNVTANGTTSFSGNLTRHGTGQPVANATVVLALEDRMTIVGVAVTNATGGFRAPILIAPTLDAPADHPLVPVFGAVGGEGVHVNGGPAIARINTSRPVSLFAWSYNESHYPLFPQLRGFVDGEGQPVGGALGNRSAAQLVNVTLGTTLALDVPAKAPVGQPVTVNATLSDSLGRPVRNANVTFQPANATNVTDADGRVRVTFALPHVPGWHAVNATFNGTALLLNASAEGRVRLTDTTRLDLVAPPGTLRPNESFSMAGLLRDREGRPVPSASVRLQMGTVDLAVATDEAGRFEALVTLPPDTPLGNVTLQADYAGNETLEPARAFAALPISGLPRWEAKPLVLAVGARGTLEARLLDYAGKPLADRDVSLLGPDGAPVPGRTDAEGKVRLPVDARFVPPGQRPLLLRFLDPVHGEAQASVLLTATTTTRLTLVVGDLVRGQAGDLSGQLVDASGRPSARQPVDVRLGPFTARAVTDGEGAWSASFPLDAAGPRAGRLVATARYAGSGDGVYGASSNDTVAILRDAPDLRLADETIVATRPVLEGRLTTLVGEPLQSRQVRVRAPGGDAAVLTDERGAFRAFLTLAPDQALGPFELRVTTESEDLLKPLDATRRVVLKDQGTLRADVPAALPQGGLVRIPFTVLDSQGRAVPDARLVALLDQQEMPLQESAGAVSVQVPSGAAPGAYTLTLRVVSDVVTAQPLLQPVDVRRPTALRLEAAPPLVPGAPGEIIVVLTAGATPLPNESLVVHGAGVPLLATTGPDGVARIPVPAGRATASTYSVAYLGAGQNGASSLVVTMATAAAPAAGVGGVSPWVWAILALLLVGGVVAAVVLRRRGSDAPAAEVLRRAARRLRSDRTDVRALYDAYLGLLDLAGLDEESGDTLTFGTLLARFVEERSHTEQDVALLTDLFNKAVYAPDHLDAESVERGSEALENVARHIRAGPPAVTA